MNEILFVSDLDAPTSIAVDPERGKMYWTKAGEIPSIEFAWLDGSRRKVLLNERLLHPTGLTIDYSMDHTLYWADSKLNTIESMKNDGSNRLIVLRGTSKIVFSRMRKLIYNLKVQND